MDEREWSGYGPDGSSKQGCPHTRLLEGPRDGGMQQRRPGRFEGLAWMIAPRRVRSSVSAFPCQRPVRRATLSLAHVDAWEAMSVDAQGMGRVDSGAMPGVSRLSASRLGAWAVRR